MHLKIALIAVLGSLSLSIPCDARTTAEPAAPASEYKGIRQTGDDAKPSDRVPPGMKFIPAATFETGLDQSDIQDLELENPAEIKLFAASVPRHSVTIAPLYIGEFEVTNAQWKIYLDATDQKPSKDLIENLWTDGEIPSGHENRPVTFISYGEVTDFCRWAMVRLPTEHEWEYAARGAEGLVYPWGNEFDDPVPKELQKRPRNAQEAEALDKARAALRRGGNMAWCGDSKVRGKRGPQVVGTMQDGRSPFGLEDAAGNVWEWTSSPYSMFPDYRDIKIKSKGTRGRAQKYSAAEFFNSERRVLKGGAFDSPGLALRSDIRQFAEKGSWFMTIGFRMAKSAQPGLDAVRYALSDVGEYQFHEKTSPLAFQSIQAVELAHFDGDDHVTGHQGIVFAPTGDWLKYGKRSDAERDSLKAPLPIGLLTMSETSLYPPIPAGTYVIAFQGVDKKWKAPPTFESGPSKDWTFNGWQAFDTSYKPKETSKKKSPKKKKPRRRSNKKDDAAAEGEEGAEGEEAPEPTQEELDLEKYRFQANEGSVAFDRTRPNLLVLDPTGTVIAALHIEDPKELSKSIGAELTRTNIGEDKRKRLPKTERFQYEWSIAMKGARKHLKFVLPLRFATDVIQADRASSKVNAEATPDDR